MKTKAAPSAIHGTGLFADEPIKRGAIVWRFDDSTEESFSPEEAEALPEPKRTRVLSLVHSYISNPDGRFILSKDDAIYFNHSFAPNVVETGDGRCAALRDIPRGEELTIDYRDYAEDNPLNFEVAMSDELRFDPSRFRLDADARSLSYCSLDATVGVDDRLVDTLVAESERRGGVNARVCLHTSPESNFHEMVILERRGYYFPPHRHTNKAQSCNILRGEAAVFVFDDAGNVKRTCVLGRDGNLIFRIGEERYHLTLPLTDFIVYHEGKPGPFEREGDSIYAEWAPKREDKEAVAKYLDHLRHFVEPRVVKGPIIGDPQEPPDVP